MANPDGSLKNLDDLAAQLEATNGTAQITANEKELTELLKRAVAAMRSVAALDRQRIAIEGDFVKFAVTAYSERLE